MRFDPLKDNFSLPAAEEKILAFWDDQQVFHKSKEAAKHKPHFVFYEGPPTANGRPGIHHVISRTVQRPDLPLQGDATASGSTARRAGIPTVCRSKSRSKRRSGSDAKPRCIEYGIAAFNQKCRESVFKYLDDWNEITRRIGYWLDLDDAYITLKNEYIESVWWILKNLFDRDLIYKGHKTVPFCPRCGTAISQPRSGAGVRDGQGPVGVRQSEIGRRRFQLPGLDHDSVDAPVERRPLHESGRRLCDGRASGRKAGDGRGARVAECSVRRGRACREAQRGRFSQAEIYPAVRYRSRISPTRRSMSSTASSSRSKTAPGLSISPPATAPMTTRSA